jgi:hypothetical protein
MIYSSKIHIEISLTSISTAQHYTFYNNWCGEFVWVRFESPGRKLLGPKFRIPDENHIEKQLKSNDENRIELQFKSNKEDNSEQHLKSNEEDNTEQQFKSNDENLNLSSNPDVLRNLCLSLATEDNQFDLSAPAYINSMNEEEKKETPIHSSSSVTSQSESESEKSKSKSSTIQEDQRNSPNELFNTNK